MTRSRLILFLCLAWAFSPAPCRAEAPDPEELRALDSMLSGYEDNIVDTGLSYGDIPAIDRPRFIRRMDADLVYEPDDPVFILEHSKGVRIYPQPVLVWHEIVNDQVQDDRIAVTYSPLTGSVMGFLSKVDMYETSFGNTGQLLNNNLVMYDRSTASLWPQIPGISVKGPLRGKRLTPFPLLWSTWEKVKTVYPDAEILSTSTGFRRSYGKDPYGSYTRSGTYYDNEMLVHPVNHLDDRLPLKARVLGIRDDELELALVKDELRERIAANFEFGITPLAVLHDQALDAFRVFDRRINEIQTLTFVIYEGQIYDKETGTRWSPQGVALEGRLLGQRLKRVPAYDVMWFAWAAYFPDTRVFPGKGALDDDW